ncbi:MAG: hypothetical protein Q9224_005653, partial [Gallowayella concinna]
MSLTYVIIDGLDECDKSTSRQISSLLIKLQSLDTPIVKTFISCRQEDQMLQNLTGVPTIQMSPSILKDDIRIFVAASVRSRVASDELRIRNPDLEKEITDELVSKAHGMFLWVYFQLDDLCEAPSDALIRKTLRNLPTGLIETYERISKRIWCDVIKRDLARRIFMWMISARRPLGIEELREAAGFEHGQKSWDSDLLPHADRMIQACKGLVIWDRGDDIVRFAHHTVRQFLLSESVDRQGATLRCTQRESESHVGEMCLTYLYFSDFETQIQVRPVQSQPEPPVDVPRAGPAQWLPDILGVRSSKYDLPRRLIASSSASLAPNIDYAKYLKPRAAAGVTIPSQEYRDKYRLLEYVSDNWIFHTREMDSAPSSLKIRELAMTKNLPFEFRPWGPNKHFGPYGCVSCKPGDPLSLEAEQQLPFMSLLHYAAKIGHWPLMDTLVSQYCFHEATSGNTEILRWNSAQESSQLVNPFLKGVTSSNSENDQTIFIAIRNGHTSISKYLKPQYRVEPFTRLVAMINAAASCGHELFFWDLLSQLRSMSPPVSTYLREYGHLTLGYAAANGHQTIVNSLLREGVSIDNEIDQLGETPLSAAAANGHVHVVRFLIDKGAQLLTKGVTPLHRAAENGHAAVARVLLQQHEVDDARASFPNPMLIALDQSRETPLHKAARNGHHEVVKVMLDHSLVPGPKL